METLYARRYSSRLGLLTALLLIICLGAVVYFSAVPEHPPGFYIDESSIAYNAYLISTAGVDEHGERLPLYFRAFGDYKNPTYIYLLAGLFRLTGPSITVARQLSSTLGLATGVLLALLAWAISRDVRVAAIVAVSALFTPWLYESSRLSFEVSAYPLLTVLFLLALWRAIQNQKWHLINIIAVAVCLALLTYSYSIGRLLAPLLAAGLVIFVKRHGWRSVCKAWAAYTVSLIPLVLFALRHPGALSDRFRLLTYITPQDSRVSIAVQFVQQFLGNLNPWRWLVAGENNVRDHLPGFGSLLAVTVVLGMAGLFLVWRRDRHNPWWQFIIYGLLASVVPASLTRNQFPQLRLIAFPIFFHVLMLPALSWLLHQRDTGVAATGLDTSTGKSEQANHYGKGVVVLVALSLMVIQAAYFQWTFHTAAIDRWYIFDARFPRKILSIALDTGKQPIYLFDPPGNSGYIQAYWYAVVQGVDTSRFVHLPSDVRPPPGALVISTEEDCANCKLISKSINYSVYAVLPSAISVTSHPLPQEGFRASIHVETPPSDLKAGMKSTLNVLVKNVSAATWPTVGDEGTNRRAVGLRNRWLRTDGTLLTNQDGRSRLPYDLEPGDTAGIHLEITAPPSPGQYLLQLDVVQEDVAWFGDRGSERLTWHVTVAP
jgi:hypothetical protein